MKGDRFGYPTNPKTHPCWPLTNRSGEPLEGLIVSAYDQDLKTPENFLGKDAVTDAEGNYDISFTDTDLKVGDVESGGSDMFIRVYDGDELL